MNHEEVIRRRLEAKRKAELDSIETKEMAKESLSVNRKQLKVNIFAIIISAISLCVSVASFIVSLTS